MHLLSKLETAPREILERIATSLVNLTFLGPPADLPALLQVSKRIWTVLSRDNNSPFYTRIFSLKFDSRAAIRRFDWNCEHTVELADELVKRCAGMKRLRSRSNGPSPFVDTLPAKDDCLREDLWMAYLMFIESDGKNSQHLLHYARVDIFASKFIAPGGMLHHGTEENGGWTVDNEANALAAWLFWFTDKERVQSETPAQRQNILQALSHPFMGSFKYASSYAPITSFVIPPTVPPPTVHIDSPLPLAASPISLPCVISAHFGLEITLAYPLFTPAILLSCVTRLEAAGAEVALPLSPDIPATRAEAVANGWQGPTLEDYDEQNKVTTRFVDWDDDNVARSERHEHDWMRLRTCYNPWNFSANRNRVYTPGMLDGLWIGRWFGIPMNEFESMLSSETFQQPAGEPTPPVVYPVPMQLRIREHHQHEQNDVVNFDDMSCDGTGKGVFNAWLPERTTMAENKGTLQVCVPNTRVSHSYQTYDPSSAAQAALDEELHRENEHDGLYGQGIWDIILTAETDDAFGEVWGRKRYHGRVRDWDGLVVLVREAMDDEGQWIFRGYVHTTQNLVGRWRETGTPVDAPGWEGVWSLTKKAS